MPMMLAKGDLKQCHIFFSKIFQCTCYNIHKNMLSKTCHGVIDVRIIDASSSQLISSFLFLTNIPPVTALERRHWKFGWLKLQVKLYNTDFLPSSAWRGVGLKHKGSMVNKRVVSECAR